MEYQDKEYNRLIDGFCDGLLRQIAWNSKQIKKMLETEEKSKTIFRLQGMLIGYDDFYIELATLILQAHDNVFEEEGKEIAPAELNRLIEQMKNIEPQCYLSFFIKDDVVLYDANSSAELENLWYDKSFFSNRYEDNLEKAIEQKTTYIGNMVLLFESGTRTLYVSQGEACALNFYKTLIRHVDDAHSDEVRRQKREAEEMALFHQNEEDDAE